MARQTSPLSVQIRRRRSRTAYVTTLLIMGMVLFFLGLFGAFFLFAGKFAKDLEQSVQLKVFLHDGLPEAQRLNFEAWLEVRPYVEGFEFVSKDSAGQVLLRRTGEDIPDILDGFNPLPDAYNVYVDQAWLQPDSLASIKAEMQSYLLVSDIEYPLEMINKLRRNYRTLSVILVLTGTMLLGIALYLIFGAIRLSIFAQRLTIRSMQLIGATEAFIRRPFLWRGLGQGFLAGIIGCLLLVNTLWAVESYLSQMDLQSRLLARPDFIGLFAGIVLLGSLLGWSGSYLAVNRYLSRNLDELM
jgi:cell division transport system permease protein